MSKSATVSITFEVGKVMLVDLPDYFEAGSMINGKASKCIFLVAEAFTFLNLDHSQQISVSRFNGTPIANKVVYLLDGNSWPNKLLQNLTTNQKGLATFSLNTANLPEAALNLVVRFALFCEMWTSPNLLHETNSFHSPGKCDSRGCL